MSQDDEDQLSMPHTLSGYVEALVGTPVAIKKKNGKRNSVDYLDFGTQSDGVASSGDSEQGGHLDANQMEIAEDGSFEINLSCEEKPGNWLRMTPNTSTLIVRQTFQDRETEVPAELVIERVGGDGTPQPLSAEALDAGLRQSAGLVASCAALFSNWARPQS
jgi:hypothetical protein